MCYHGYELPIKCPRCEAMNDPEREKCRICNCPLENYCSDESCMASNVEKARLCKYCGRPTVFNKYHVFDETIRARYVLSAKNYFLINKDTDDLQE